MDLVTLAAVAGNLCSRLRQLWAPGIGLGIMFGGTLGSTARQPNIRQATWSCTSVLAIIEVWLCSAS